MSTIILIIFLHLLGDSVLLGKELRRLKIHKFGYLLKHVGIYTLVFMIFSPIILGLTIVQGLIFSLLNGVLHLIVDYLLTLVKLKYWTKDIYTYVVIYSILEHLIHIAILIGTFLYLFPGVADLESWLLMAKQIIS
jgi:hypothetical protein